MKSTHPPGEPMDVGNMRRLGVRNLVAYCLNPSCRHEGLIDVSKFADNTEVPSFARKVVCAKCGAPRSQRVFRPVEYFTSGCTQACAGCLGAFVGSCRVDGRSNANLRVAPLPGAEKPAWRCATVRAVCCHKKNYEIIAPW